MYSYLKTLKNMSIRKKIMLINLTIISVMFILLGISNYLISRKTLSDGYLDSSKKIIRQLGQNLDVKIEQFNEFVVKESFESEVYKALNPIYNERRYDSQKRVQTFSINLMNYNKYVKVVLLMDNSGNSYKYAAYPRQADEYVQEELINQEDVKQLWGKTYWTPYNNELIFCSRVLFDKNTMQQIGILTIGLNSDFFRNIYNDITKEEDNDIILLNRDRHVLVKSGKNAEGIIKKIEQTDEEEREIFYGEKKYLITSKKLGKSGLCIINLINTKSIADKAAQMLIPTWYVVVLAIVLSVLLAIWLYKELESSLKILSSRIADVERGDLSVKDKPVSQDEIGSVIKAFDEMVIKMNGLMNDIAEEKNQKKNAQLKALQFEYDALQAKLNPHFLYNTLESINSLAKLNHDEVVADSINLLGKYLRETISKRGKYVMLKEEIVNVRHYIKLQNMSFGERIHLDLNLDPILMETMVPKLILQPLVENSIVHGIEPRAGWGYIRIESRCIGKDMEIVVEDNGIGISGEWLKRGIPEENNEGTRTKVGLEAVHKRLRILYGENYGIHLTRGLISGTIVTLKMPIVFKEEIRK